MWENEQMLHLGFTQNNHYYISTLNFTLSKKVFSYFFKFCYFQKTFETWAIEKQPAIENIINEKLLEKIIERELSGNMKPHQNLNS